MELYWGKKGEREEAPVFNKKIQDLPKAEQFFLIYEKQHFHKMINVFTKNFREGKNHFLMTFYFKLSSSLGAC